MDNSNKSFEKGMDSDNDATMRKANRLQEAASYSSFRAFENLPYSEALIRLKEGSLVKLPEWEGFWFPVGGKIWVFTKDGEILDTPDHETFGVRNDWTQVVGPEILTHFIKTVRVRIDSIMNHIKADVTPSREASLAYTAAQLGFMFLGLHLGALGAANPYPKSTDPSSPVIEKHADKADQYTDYLGKNAMIFPDETAKVKFLRLELQNHLDFITAVCKETSSQGPFYWAVALDKLIEAKLWLGQCLNNIRVASEQQK